MQLHSGSLLLHVYFNSQTQTVFMRNTITSTIYLLCKYEIYCNVYSSTLSKIVVPLSHGRCFFLYDCNGYCPGYRFTRHTKAIHNIGGLVSNCRPEDENKVNQNYICVVLTLNSTPWFNGMKTKSNPSSQVYLCSTAHIHDSIIVTEKCLKKLDGFPKCFQSRDALYRPLSVGMNLSLELTSSIQ